MARAFPRVPQPSANSRHKDESAAIEEAREVPESSLRSIPEDQRLGAPPAICISTTHDRNSTPSASQTFNHWPASPPLLLSRGRAQPDTASSQVQQNSVSSTRPVQNSPRSNSQFPFSIREAHATSTPTSTYLLALPSAPPPLRRRPPIALPSLSPLHPIQIHSFISSDSSPCGPDAPIYWNVSLPPSTARLAAALGGLAAARWSREVALEPRALTSLTIRIVGVARPVVVFPAEMWYPIRIVDVLRAIYVALCCAALESAHGRVVGVVSLGGGSGFGESVGAEEAAAADAIRRHFCGGVWWGGLYESTDERDVWILKLRPTERKWY